VAGIGTVLTRLTVLTWGRGGARLDLLALAAPGGRRAPWRVAARPVRTAAAGGDRAGLLRSDGAGVGKEGGIAVETGPITVTASLRRTVQGVARSPTSTCVFLSSRISICRYVWWHVVRSHRHRVHHRTFLCQEGHLSLFGS
jgi:hypothetical protein